MEPLPIETNWEFLDEDDDGFIRKGEEVEKEHVDGEYSAECTEEDTKEAKRCIEIFFKNKDYYCGGPIPEVLLYSEDNIERMLYTDFNVSIDIAYKLFSSSNGINCEIEDEEDISEDQEIVLGILKECMKLKIPKRFRNGLILMYLGLCLGYKI